MLIQCWKRKDIEEAIKDIEASAKSGNTVDGHKWTVAERDQQINQFHYYRECSTWGITAIFISIVPMMLIPAAFKVTAALFFATVIYSAYYAIREECLIRLFKQQIEIKQT